MGAEGISCVRLSSKEMDKQIFSQEEQMKDRSKFSALATPGEEKVREDQLRNKRTPFIDTSGRNIRRKHCVPGGSCAKLEVLC